MRFSPDLVGCRFLLTMHFSSGCFWTFRPPRADEGMWLLNFPPIKLLKEKNFVPTEAWLAHLQQSAVPSTTAAPGGSYRPTGW